MRVLLLILAGISGLMNAYMLGNIEEVNEENKDNFEDTLVFLGRRGLQEQKDFLFRFIRFGILSFFGRRLSLLSKAKVEDECRLSVSSKAFRF